MYCTSYLEHLRKLLVPKPQAETVQALTAPALDSEIQFRLCGINVMLHVVDIEAVTLRLSSPVLMLALEATVYRQRSPRHF